MDNLDNCFNFFPMLNVLELTATETSTKKNSHVLSNLQIYFNEFGNLAIKISCHKNLTWKVSESVDENRHETFTNKEVMSKKKKPQVQCVHFRSRVKPLARGRAFPVWKVKDFILQNSREFWKKTCFMYLGQSP